MEWNWTILGCGRGATPVGRGAMSKTEGFTTLRFVDAARLLQDAARISSRMFELI